MGRLKIQGRSLAGRFPSTGRPRGYVREKVYRPEFCEMVIEFGKHGWSEAEMAFNGFGVTRSAMRAWAKKYPEFGEALEAAKEAARAWWESVGRLNLTRDKFNTGLYNKIISCRFRDEYSDRIVHAGDQDQPVVTRIERVIVKPK